MCETTAAECTSELCRDTSWAVGREGGQRGSAGGMCTESASEGNTHKIQQHAREWEKEEETSRRQ